MMSALRKQTNCVVLHCNAQFTPTPPTKLSSFIVALGDVNRFGDSLREPGIIEAVCSRITLNKTIRNLYWQYQMLCFMFTESQARVWRCRPFWDTAYSRYRPRIAGIWRRRNDSKRCVLIVSLSRRHDDITRCRAPTTREIGIIITPVSFSSSSLYSLYIFRSVFYGQ